jgi:hypothetical protein
MCLVRRRGCVFLWMSLQSVRLLAWRVRSKPHPRGCARGCVRVSLPLGPWQPCRSNTCPWQHMPHDRQVFHVKRLGMRCGIGDAPPGTGHGLGMSMPFVSVFVCVCLFASLTGWCLPSICLLQGGCLGVVLPRPFPRRPRWTPPAALCLVASCCRCAL